MKSNIEDVRHHYMVISREDKQEKEAYATKIVAENHIAAYCSVKRKKNGVDETLYYYDLT